MKLQGRRGNGQGEGGKAESEGHHLLLAYVHKHVTMHTRGSLYVALWEQLHEM